MFPDCIVSQTRQVPYFRRLLLPYTDRFPRHSHFLFFFILCLFIFIFIHQYNKYSATVIVHIYEDSNNINLLSQVMNINLTHENSSLVFFRSFLSKTRGYRI